MAFCCYLTSVVVLIIAFTAAYGQQNPQVTTFDFLKTKRMSVEAYHEKTVNYWTPERMRAAKPIEEVLRNRSNRTSSQRKIVPEQVKDDDGQPVVIEGKLPDANGSQGRLIAPANQVIRTTGKVFFSDVFGDYSCSGNVVTSTGGSLVATAAHCIYDVDYGYWYSDWMFAPAYDYGDTPLGMWTAIYAAIPNGYSNSLSFSQGLNYDVSFVVVARIAGRKISQITGSQGIGFNLPRFPLTFLFGYPGDIAEGEIMSACITRPVSQFCGSATYLGQAARCGMGGGCSGGPWIINFNSNTGLGTQISVNSFTCVQMTPYMLHGPYFGVYIKPVYDLLKARG